MLSVGTTTESAALAGGGTLNRGLADWAAGKKLLDVTMAAQQSLAQQLTKDMLREQYFQINAIQSPSQAKTLALDSATLSATATLKIMAEGSVEEAKNDPRLMQFLNHQGLKRAW